MIAAFVRLRAGHELDVEGLRQLVRAAIGPHAAPRLIEVVDSFPLTSSGKIIRSQLQRA